MLDKKKNNMEISADLVTSNLLCIKFKEEITSNMCEKKTIASTFRLVHTRGSYYISLGICMSLGPICWVLRNQVSKNVKMELSLKWHLHKPINFDDEDSRNLVNVKEMHGDSNVHLHYPSDVWIVVGQDQELLKLKNNKNSSVWNWESSGYDISHSYIRGSDSHFPCNICIKFDTHSGETQSLKVFKDIFARQINCDVQFCFDGGNQIGAHAAVLGVRSRVFAAMFQNGMIESKSRQVVIKLYKSEFFFELLHYIYAGRVSSELTEQMSQSLWMLADMYEIGELKEECVLFLLSSIRIENVVEVLAWAHAHSVEEVKEGALYFMELNGKDVVESKQWEDLTKEHPELSLLAIRRMMRKTSPPSEKEDAYKILQIKRDSDEGEEEADDDMD